jgi:DNA replication protein DnaC
MLKNGLSVSCMTAKDIGNALLLYLQGDNSKWLDIENCEVIVIKDIDYLIEKTATQEELSKLIQAKSKNGAHTIIETNCAIKELTVLSQCLLDNSKFLLL